MKWAGHVLADSITFARHGTHAEAFEVVVQSLTVGMENGHWTAELVPFRIGGEVVSAVPHDLFTIADWEIGFSNIMGCGMTTLLSLIALTVLNLRKNLRGFPWFAVAFVLYSVIFDQVLYTYVGPNPELLVSAVLMGVNPFLFKGLVIGLVLVQGWLFIRFAVRYRRGRRAAAARA